MNASSIPLTAIICGCALLTDCAHAFDPDPQQSQQVAAEVEKPDAFRSMPPRAGSGRVYIYRNQLSRAGNLVPFTLFVDGRPLGDLGMDRYADLTLEPGEHVLTGKLLGETNLPITVVEGEVSFVKLNDASLELVANKIGRKEIGEDCELGYRKDLAQKPSAPTQPKRGTTSL